MAKTKEELRQLREECETVAAKLCELSEEELSEVTGGEGFDDFVDRMFDKYKDYFQKTKPAIKPICPTILPGTIDKDR